MLRIVRSGLLWAGLAAPLLSGPFAPSQQAKDAVPAPVPAQIISAKKVFIANAGQESNPNAGAFGEYGGGPNRMYNQFYSALKSWGRYELVSTPTDCDLVFEIRFTDPTAAGTVLKGDSVGAHDEPQFRLVILDAKTKIVLWGFTEHVQSANFQAHRDKNFDQALAKIVDDLKGLAAQPADPGAEVQK